MSPATDWIRRSLLSSPHLPSQSEKERPTTLSACVARPCADPLSWRSPSGWCCADGSLRAHRHFEHCRPAAPYSYAVTIHRWAHRCVFEQPSLTSRWISILGTWLRGGEAHLLVRVSWASGQSSNFDSDARDGSPAVLRGEARESLIGKRLTDPSNSRAEGVSRIEAGGPPPTL